MIRTSFNSGGAENLSLAFDLFRKSTGLKGAWGERDEWGVGGGTGYATSSGLPLSNPAEPPER